MKSGDQWMKEKWEKAKEAFSEHQITKKLPGHWQIKRPGESVLWADIAVMGGVGLAVWGDIDGCFFAYCSGAKSTEDVVAWLGAPPNPDIGGYCREKAHIGMGGHELVEEYSSEVALHDLHYYADDIKEHYDEEEWNEPRRGQSTIGETYNEAFSDAIDMINNGEDVRYVQRRLHEDIMNEDQEAYEWVYSIGRVTSTRVIFAVAS